MTPPPRHILMTTDTVGGVWIYATALATGLAQQGTRVTLMTLGPPPQGAKQDWLQAAPLGLDVIVTDLALEWLDPEGNDAARAGAELLHIADQIGPDLVHLNGYREGAIAWPCPSIVVAHSCVLSWWQAARNEWPSEARWSIYADNVAAGLNAANAWVAPTAAFRDTVRKLYRPATPGWIIPNGIDVDTHDALPKQPVILASGRVWDGGKNLLALADIASDLPWPVEIAGAGMPEAAQASAKNIRWLGELEHTALQEQMRRAAVYVAPAHYEPFGLGILEAANAGCALVLSDIASLRELWDGAALQVPPSDRARLREAIRQVCEDEGLRRRLQYAAMERARHYSLDRMVASYIELYERALARGPKTSVALTEGVPA